MWSRSPDEKDHDEMQWYAKRGIAEYWLVTPIEGAKRDARIARFKLTFTDGQPNYKHESTTTLSKLSQ